MIGRIALGVWGLLGTVALVVAFGGGGLSTTEVVDGVAAAVAAVALFAVVKIPWDLYFGARHVQLGQQDSRRRGIQLQPGEEEEAARLARRLLALAVGLHLLGAAVSLAASLASGGRFGVFAAAAFLVTMLIRPASAMVVHVKARLRDLGRRAKLPRDDSVALDGRLTSVEARLDGLERGLLDERRGLEALWTHHDRTTTELQRAAERDRQRHLHEVDRLGLEMERALEKVSDDRELLAGLRAFLRLVKES